MGLDKFSALSFEEMAEQQEAAEVKTPVAVTSPEATPVAEAVAPEPVTTEAGDKSDCKDEPCNCKETPKTE
jgi:hypothetical protein